VRLHVMDRYPRDESRAPLGRLVGRQGADRCHVARGRAIRAGRDSRSGRRRSSVTRARRATRRSPGCHPR
jgi:hypothetical protein